MNKCFASTELPNCVVTRSLTTVNMCTPFRIPVAAENNRRNSDESCELWSSELIVSVCDKQCVRGGPTTLYSDAYATHIATQHHDPFRITAHLVSLDWALQCCTNINTDHSNTVSDNRWFITINLVENCLVTATYLTASTVRKPAVSHFLYYWRAYIYEWSV
jgi:hypothetical protein